MKHTILIVDDVIENISILGELLSEDHEVCFATSGEDALAMMASPQQIDLILLDVMMPGIDGHEVCRRLKADEATRDVPIIFVTAMEQEQDETTGLKLGAVDYIRKPFSAHTVLARVHTHLTLHDARRTLARQNEQLLEAARLREDVDAILRHDLKGPLTSVVSLPKLMKQDPDLKPRHAKYLGIIEQAGLRTLLMINRSLDLLKIERGTYELAPEAVDILEVVREIIDENQALARARGVAVELDAGAGEGGVMVLCERLLSHAALTNLLVNAIEASPDEGKVEVTVVDDDGPTVRIHNQGAVPPEIRSRFFDKYVTARKDSGTGLGTYSARRMIEAQQGSVEMQTDEQSGTTLTVRLPRAAG
jgi:signal transduction histidine kinase